MTALHSVLRLTMTYLLVGLALPCLGMQQSDVPQGKQISISDSIFKVAVNSPGYLVVKKSDWEALKKAWNDSVNTKLEKLEAQQSAVNRKMDSLQRIPVPQDQTLDLPESPEKSDADFEVGPVLIGVLLLFLLGNGLGLVLFFSRKTKGIKDQNERLKLLENELSEYKTASIQRERKLMRELIDTRHALEEEKAKQSSGNEEKD